MQKGDILISGKGIEARIVDISNNGEELEIVQNNGYIFFINRRVLQKQIKLGKLKWKVRK